MGYGWRRVAARVIVAVAGVGGCASGGQEAMGRVTTAPSGVRRPNVVVILADDLGYADVGCQGQAGDVRTPNIDSIARSGVRFTNGYVSCPICSPSRAGFLTGRYQQRFGHEFNPGPAAADVFGLPLDQVTLAEEMRKAGYATGIMGKWHEGTRADYRPMRRGFDEFYGFLGGAHAYLGQSAKAGDNSIRRGDEPITEPEYLTDAITREAVSFIDRHKEKPFFLYVPYNAVHAPQQATQKYLDRFPEVSDSRRRYLLAMLSAEDDGVGRILQALRDRKLEEDTLVVFFSDNGGPTGQNGSRNAPLSGFKGQVWEGGIRIPFMMQWKGHVAGGRVLDQPVISLDLFPTALAAAGGEVPKDRVIDGVNLLPLLSGKTEEAPHPVLYWRFGSQWAIREGKWKLVGFPRQGEKLFDLASDIGEQHDLAGEHPDVVARLREDYGKWNAQLMAPRWERAPGPAERRRGRAAAALQGAMGVDEE